MQTINSVSTSLRILYVDTEEVWRGGQEQLFSLMRGMKCRGHAVELAAPPRSPLLNLARENGIPTHFFTQRRELSLMAVWNLKKILGIKKFDLLHFNTPRPIFAGGLAAFLSGVPVTVSSRRVNFPLRSFLSRFKYNWIHDNIVTVSTSIHQTLVQCGVQAKRISVIYEGLDLKWIDGLPPTGLLRQRSGLVVGTVAHLSPEKGHLTLLEAAARLRKRFPDVVYVFVGEGELKGELEDRAHDLGLSEQIVFTGFRKDCESLMREFDIFCLASVSEGLSSAILAAMARALPVVATRVGGIPELVQDGLTGLLVPPRRPDRLAEALDTLLSLSSLRSCMGLAGRKRIEENFTLDRKLDQTEELYLKLRHRGP